MEPEESLHKINHGNRSGMEIILTTLAAAWRINNINSGSGSRTEAVMVEWCGKYGNSGGLGTMVMEA